MNKKIIGGVCVAVVVSFLIGVAVFTNTSGGIENVYYFSQIFSALFVVLGVVIALMQYLHSNEEQRMLQNRELEIREREILELEKERVQKAIDLADYYKDNILGYINIIDSVYEDSGIKEILTEIDFQKMKEFDQHELETLLTPSQINTIKSIGGSEKFKEAVIKNSFRYGYGEKAKTVHQIVDADGKAKSVVDINQSIIFREYSTILNKALNNTEYFAMNFTHKTADDTVVYQSLHVTYLQLMRLLYFDISRNNRSGSEKFYTNAIELFNTWKDCALKMKNEAIEKQRSIINKGTELPLPRG